VYIVSDCFCGRYKVKLKLALHGSIHQGTSEQQFIFAVMQLSSWESRYRFQRILRKKKIAVLQNHPCIERRMVL